MTITKDMRFKAAVGICVFILTYLGVWLSFWAMGIMNQQAETLAMPYRLALGVLSSFGYVAFLVSIPVQLVVQNILATLGIVQPEAPGVVTYSSWVTFFVAAFTITLIVMVALAFLPTKKKVKS